MNSLYWSVRRELWENRSIYVAPMIGVAIVLAGFSLSLFTLPRKVRAAALNPTELHQIVQVPFVAAAIILLIFIPLARRIRRGEPLRGRFGNLIEAFVLFLRDEVARPAIGAHDADRFLPFVWMWDEFPRSMAFLLGVLVATVVAYAMTVAFMFLLAERLLDVIK